MSHRQSRKTSDHVLPGLDSSLVESVVSGMWMLNCSDLIQVGFFQPSMRCCMSKLIEVKRALAGGPDVLLHVKVKSLQTFSKGTSKVRLLLYSNLN